MPDANLTDAGALALILRGGPQAGLRLSDALVDAACAHGVDALLSRAAGASAPPDVAARLKQCLIGHEALAAARQVELCRVLAALADAGVRPLVIKGGHLAHVLYSSPALRPRADTDLLIDPRDESRTEAALAAIGYTRAAHVRGAVILGQWHVRRADAALGEHALDVHWRLASPLVFRHLLPFHVLSASADAIPPLGAAARGPALPHALVIACVHLVAHHRDDPILLWLYEIDALASRLDPAGRRAFVDAAAAADVTRVCAAALERALAYFPGDAVAALREEVLAAGRGTEPSAAVLRATRPVDELWLDLKVSRGWRERASLLKEHLWPDAEYMRATHARSTPLPLAYARRAARGVLHWTAASASRRTAESAGPLAGSPEASGLPVPSKTSR